MTNKSILPVPVLDDSQNEDALVHGASNWPDL